MFTRIHHVAIVVRDMGQALSVFRDVVGIPVGKRATVADQGVHAALLPMADGEIELLEPADPAGGVARFLEKRGEGFHHLCFETPDIAAALAQVKAAALPLIDQIPRPGLAGMIAFLHPKANHGVLIEMAQPLEPPAHPEPPSNGIRTTGFCTVYLAVKALLASAETYARNFHANVSGVQDDARFGAKKVEIAIGTSQLTLLGSADARSPVGCFLADRGEGLFGVCLRVKDFWGAVRHLEGKDIRTDVHGRETPTPLARLDPPRVHGLNLFFSP